MGETVRFGVSIGRNLLKRFDELIAEKGYTNRSESIRDLIRDHIVVHEWEAENQETVGTVTLVYDHETRELTHVLTSLQHRYHPVITSALHIHLDEHNCLEVLVIKDRVKRIKEIADKLISVRGVKYGKLTMATSGKELF